MYLDFDDKISNNNIININIRKRLIKQLGNMVPEVNRIIFILFIVIPITLTLSDQSEIVLGGYENLGKINRHRLSSLAGSNRYIEAFRSASLRPKGDVGKQCFEVMNPLNIICYSTLNYGQVIRDSLTDDEPKKQLEDIITIRCERLPYHRRPKIDDDGSTKPRTNVRYNAYEEIWLAECRLDMPRVISDSNKEVINSHCEKILHFIPEILSTVDDMGNSQMKMEKKLCRLMRFIGKELLRLDDLFITEVCRRIEKNRIEGSNTSQRGAIINFCEKFVPLFDIIFVPRVVANAIVSLCQYIEQVINSFIPVLLN